MPKIICANSRPDYFFFFIIKFFFFFPKNVAQTMGMSS